MGHFVAAVHDIANSQQQFAAECATRMRQREIFRRETTRFQQRDGQRIAHHQRGGGAGGRRQPQRAGFLRHLDAQVDIRRFAHRAFRIVSHTDEGELLAFQYRDQRQDLAGFAGVGDGEHDVLRGDHAQIAMAGLRRVNEE